MLRTSALNNPWLPGEARQSSTPSASRPLPSGHDPAKGGHSGSKGPSEGTMVNGTALGSGLFWGLGMGQLVRGQERENWDGGASGLACLRPRPFTVGALPRCESSGAQSQVNRRGGFPGEVVPNGPPSHPRKAWQNRRRFHPSPTCGQFDDNCLQVSEQSPVS